MWILKLARCVIKYRVWEMMEAYIHLQSLLLVWLIKILTGGIVLILGCGGRSYTSRQNKTHVTFSHDKKHKSSFGIWACRASSRRKLGTLYSDNFIQIIILDLRNIKHWFLLKFFLLLTVHYKLLKDSRAKTAIIKIRTYCIKYYS